MTIRISRSTAIISSPVASAAYAAWRWWWGCFSSAGGFCGAGEATAVLYRVSAADSACCDGMKAVAADYSTAARVYGCTVGSVSEPEVFGQVGWPNPPALIPVPQ